MISRTERDWDILLKAKGLDVNAQKEQRWKGPFPNGVIAIGPALAGCPSRRSVRAGLPHTALTSDDDEHAARRGEEKVSGTFRRSRNRFLPTFPAQRAAAPFPPPSLTLVIHGELSWKRFDG
jgi:hypothetical protein